MVQESQASAAAAVSLEATDAVAVLASPKTTDPRIRGRMPALDGVRGLAILMVLFVHFFADTVPTNRFESVVTRISGFGVYGVDLFFVLSGFLITGILVDSKGGGGYFRNFYARRALRIFPLYYGVLIAVLIVASIATSSPNLQIVRSRQAWAWLYGINVFSALRGEFSFPYIDHFWSLAVEEHFYFFWPLVVWLCSRDTLLRVCVGLALASLAARVIGVMLGVNTLALDVLTPFRLDGLCTGAAFAVYARRAGGLDALARFTQRLAIGGVVLFAASHLVSTVEPGLFGPMRQLRTSLFMIFLGHMMIAALRSPSRAWLSRFFGPKLQFLGTYSYGLYVFHHLISYYFVAHRTEFVVAKWVGSHTVAVFLQALAGMSLSLGIAMASYHLFEKRFLVLKRRWEPQAGGARLQTR
jgi:peptidoglycan/LPS O-acetylase OafA/YrhL